MISSRRLAREWALKILYQMDVGKVGLEEAQEAALERLRGEFVQRGSRTASGSSAELACLEYVTADLRDTLPAMTLPMERATATCIERLLEEAPYWQELRVERAFKTILPAVRLSPPRLLTPLPDPMTDVPTAHLSQEERARLQRFADDFRAVFPMGKRQFEEDQLGRERYQKQMEADMRTRGRAFAKSLRERMPFELPPAALADWLLTEREQFNAANASRWEKIGEIVKKQTADWMRVAAFTSKLVQGTQARREEIDPPISELASGWGLERLVSVDRNILRMAAFEMMYMPGIPASASINEAVELAKKYSTADSSRFVNGVLGALVTKLGDAAKAAEDNSLEIDTEDAVLDLPEIAELEENETE